MVAIITAQHNNQPPLFYASTNKGITKLQLSEKVKIETSPDKLLEVLKSVEEKLNKFIEKDEIFKRKLTLTISQMYERQEITLDVHDKMKALTEEWFGKD